MAKNRTKRAPRDEMLRILVTFDQKEKLSAAAEAAGLSVSSWGLTVMLKAAND